MGHNGVPDNPGAQAAEAVPRRVGDHHPPLPAIGRFGQFLREPGERHAVHGEPSTGIGGGLDTAAVRPAAHGIGADPQEARRLLDPEGGHPATLTQVQLKVPIPGAFARDSGPILALSTTGLGRHFPARHRDGPRITRHDGRMNAGRLPLFCDTALAGRIERAEVGLIAGACEAARRRRPEAGGFAIPAAGGLATFAGDGSPFNKVAGLGFGGVPDTAALDEIERAFAARSAPVQVELAHLADPAIGAMLTGRGYRLVSFENVLGLAITGTPEPVTPAGIEVRPSGDDEF